MYLSWCNCSQGSNQFDQHMVISHTHQCTLHKWLCVLEAKFTFKYPFPHQRLRNWMDPMWLCCEEELCKKWWMVCSRSLKKQIPESSFFNLSMKWKPPPKYVFWILPHSQINNKHDLKNKLHWKPGKRKFWCYRILDQGTSYDEIHKGAWFYFYLTVELTARVG
jgi:hypothetical protein